MNAQTRCSEQGGLLNNGLSRRCSIGSSPGQLQQVPTQKEQQEGSGNSDFSDVLHVFRVRDVGVSPIVSDCRLYRWSIELRNVREMAEADSDYRMLRDH